MKEIDFIPEWYKANQKRRRSHHRQYVLLVMLFALIAGWNFIAGRHVERACAEARDARNMVERGKTRVDEGMRLEAEIEDFKKQIRLFEMTRPRTNISAVIAELSCLMGDNIILSKLSLNSEEIETEKKTVSMPAAIVQIQMAAGKGQDGAEKFLKQTRTRVTLTGIAAQSTDAARLLSRLEQSDYFEQESLFDAKPKTVKKHEVTAFEIRCTVADYKIDKQD